MKRWTGPGFAFAVAVFTPVAWARGAVHTVGPLGAPGVDFRTLQEAVDFASDGDTIVLLASAEPSKFTLDGKGLTIVGAGPGPSPLRGGSQVRNLEADQVVVLRSLETALLDRDALRVLDCAGPVWVEDCDLMGSHGKNIAFVDFDNDHGKDAVLVEGSELVTLVACTLTGGNGASVDDDFEQSGVGRGGNALEIVDSQVTVFGGVFTGGFGGSMWDSQASSGEPGGNGVELFGGSLFASGTHFEGRDGGYGGDDIFSGCGNGASGGHGVRLSANEPEVVYLDCAFEPGSGGWGCGEQAASGEDLEVVSGQATALPGTRRELEVNAPVASGETIRVTVHGLEGEFAFALLDPAIGQTHAPDWLGVLVTSPTPRAFALGPIPASGSITVESVAGPLPTGLESLHVTVQGALVSLSGLQLGHASMLILLDEAP